MNKLKSIARRGLSALIGRGKRLATSTRLLTAALAAAAAMASGGIAANAQVTGTYVNPRVQTVFNQWVTNGGTYGFVFTNWLNYSGWHNIGLIVSQQSTNVNGLGTNALNVKTYGSPGSGNNYTNSAMGTNYVYTSTPILTWNNSIAPSTATATNIPAIAWTNLQQTLADDWLWFSNSVSITTTNTGGTTLGGYYLQIDVVVVP